MLIFSLHLCLPFFMLFLTLLCTYKPCRESHRQKPHRSTKSNAFVAKTGCNGDVNEEIYVTLYSGCGRDVSVRRLYI